MKTIGLIGGMSWESTVPYYKMINETVKTQMGGLHSAKIVLYSVDFEEIEKLQHRGEWDEAGRILADIASRLQDAGADMVVLCTNTMHKVADSIQKNIRIPLLHIADATAQEILKAGFSRVGLLGTRFTMEEEFYKNRLKDIYGIDAVVPSKADMEIVHRVIYEELCLGQVRDESKEEFKRIIKTLVDDKVQAVILGCTEIAMLVQSQDSPVPLFDTTAIHAKSAALAAVAD